VEDALAEFNKVVDGAVREAMLSRSF